MNRIFLCLIVFVFISVLGIGQPITYTDSLTKVRIAEMNKIKPIFKSKTNKEDSVFACIYSDIYSVTSVVSLITQRRILGEEIFLSDGTYPLNASKDFINAPIGEVVGPYISGNRISLYKVKWKGMAEDSAMVRHILIAYRDAERANPELNRKKWEAKKLADSLFVVINSGKTLMDSLVVPFTNDPGSLQGNNGNYGWFARQSGFITEFKDAAFNNPVGKTVLIETQFGYHIIQVIGKKEKHYCVKVMPLERIIDHEKNYTDQASKGVTLPAFPGGMNGLRNYLKKHTVYRPDLAASDTEAYVEIMFRVGTDGKLYDIADIINDPKMDDAFVFDAKRIMRGMPDWQPAFYNGKPIDWYLRIIIPFRLYE